MSDVQDHHRQRALEQEQLTDKIVGDLKTISAHTSKLDELFIALQALTFLSPYFLLFLIIRQITFQHKAAGTTMMIALGGAFIIHSVLRIHFYFEWGCRAVAGAGLEEVYA